MTEEVAPDWTCPVCGADNEVDSQRCWHCGWDSEEDEYP